MKERSRTQRLLIVSALIDALLGLIKVIFGVLAHSHALIADGIHSLSDLATDILVWLFNRVGTQAPDADHPYGHARFETLGTMILGAVLITIAGLLIYDNIMRLIDYQEVPPPEWMALLIAAFSIAVKEALYHVTRRVGEATRSKLLVANAWHHRSDALSSIIVFVGVGGAMAGLIWLEMVAAIGVALMIAAIGWDLTRQSVEELVDTAQSQSYVRELRKQIQEIEGIRGVHSIRTRRMGPDVLVDVHVQVEPYVSVSEGHHIGEWVTRNLLDSFDDINDVIVHIDAEDDRDAEPGAGTPLPPLRNKIRNELIETWSDLVAPEDIRKLTLHFLGNRINVELFLSRRLQTEPDLHQSLKGAAARLPWLGSLTIWFD